MEEFRSSQFGVLRFEGDRVIETPLGLPAFESERRFVAIEEPDHAPVVFLQSLQTPDLAFITLPVTFLVGDYALAIEDEDLAVVGWDGEANPVIGREVLCLAIITVGPDHRATANLMAPLVVNLANRKAIQVIQPGGYSHQHPLGEGSKEETC